MVLTDNLFGIQVVHLGGIKKCAMVLRISEDPCGCPPFGTGTPVGAGASLRAPGRQEVGPAAKASFARFLRYRQKRKQELINDLERRRPELSRLFVW